MGFALSNASVIFNPVKVIREIIPYPDTAGGYKLACPGRYFLLDKGQDILIRVMSLKKWQERPVKVQFFGAGYDRPALEDLARFLKVSNVVFREYSHDVAAIWKESHALIIPSRAEGMPLVLLEAMCAGRTTIACNAGGNAEILTDNVDGFIGEPFESTLDEAMERAWQAREQWEEMGRRASEKIQSTVPDIPEKVFANLVKTTIHA